LDISKRLLLHICIQFYTYYVHKFVFFAAKNFVMIVFPKSDSLFANRRGPSIFNFAPGWGSPPDPLERRVKRDLERPEKNPGGTILSCLYRQHAGVSSHKLRMQTIRQGIRESETRKLNLLQKCLALMS